MKLVEKQRIAVERVVYSVECSVGRVTYVEFVDEGGLVIDEALRDGDGFAIEDAALLEEVQEFVDSL